jgi:hypothetical protein
MNALFLLAAFGTGAALGCLVTAWIQNRPRKISPEFRECINRIFEGTEGQKKGRAWLDKEMEDPAYIGHGSNHHEFIHEPEDGAELDCVYMAKYRKWVPVGYGWPDVLHRTGGIS